MSSYIYENRKLSSLLYKKGLITLLMRAFEILVPGGEVYDKNLSYLMSFFTYGYFGIIYQWIKYDFDETPEQVKAHIDGVIFLSFSPSILYIWRKNDCLTGSAGLTDRPKQSLS